MCAAGACITASSVLLRSLLASLPLFMIVVTRGFG
jgi:hypothetical protein